ncbi:unnamed protein product [Paramecium sonneborni]|uniref:Uncharacterized protein n=1 Tax=Paramecium sonneborni TaxID=65129 RepID=A0A8S1R9W4_9CILI|nr:unnamed protein product [Paramecium sonneborni]
MVHLFVVGFQVQSFYCKLIGSVGVHLPQGLNLQILQVLRDQSQKPVQVEPVYISQVLGVQINSVEFATVIVYQQHLSDYNLHAFSFTEATLQLLTSTHFPLLLVVVITQTQKLLELPYSQAD